MQYNVDHDDDVHNNKAIEESTSKEHDPSEFQLPQTLEMLLISELEEQREIKGLKEIAGTKEIIEFLTFPSEWKDYEQTMEQTDTVVENVLSDVIGSTSESLTEIQPTKLVEFEGGNIKKMSQQIQPSPTMENKEIRQIIEEKERAISLIHQLNKEKEDYQVQLDKIIFELKRAKEENSNLQNERMESERRVKQLNQPNR